MRIVRFMGLLAASSMAFAAVPSASMEPVTSAASPARPQRRTAKRRHAMAQSHVYRSRWKAEKPKRRSNRLHVSRRTRRRHRRAA